MACTEIHTWTFCALIGAFLDLALAYLLLCGSALGFFTAKFLGFFGLCLPCSCNGLFGDPNSGKCLQRLLVDCPSNKISAVQVSIKSRFPFDSIWMKDEGCHMDVKLVRDSKRRCELLDFEKEEEESGESDAPKWQKSVLCDPVGDKNEQVLVDVKGKGVLNPESQSGIRRRRRSGGKYRELSLESTSDHLLLIGQEITDAISVSENSGRDQLQHDVEAPTKIDLVEETLPSIESNEPLTKGKVTEKDGSFVQELVHGFRGELGFDENEANTIQVLKQALEEEHACRTALYFELEKERSAAASATDEAMAMILRLQKEKASIEMEARQYQRMIEEKSTYDEEEMDILKEILVRREREKHVLEKEVEVYRQMMFTGERNEQLEDSCDVLDFDSIDDPVIMLQQISESLRKKEIARDLNRSSENQLSAENQTCSRSPHWAEDAEHLKQGDYQRTESIETLRLCELKSTDAESLEFQEKGMVSMDEHSSALQGHGMRLKGGSILYESNEPQEHVSPDKPSLLAVEEQGQTHNSRICDGSFQETDQIHSETKIRFPYDGAEQENHVKDAGQVSSDSHTSRIETKSIDVHVIDDKFKVCIGGHGKEIEVTRMDTASDCFRKGGFQFQSSGVREIDVLNGNSSVSRVEAQPNIFCSSSDMTKGLPPSGRGKAVSLNLRRNSLSAVDNERIKLEAEVGWLRERLRIVQEGREKLNFSVENREREKFQLQLLEEIAYQLRAIRQLTEPGKAVRQASLPPPSSKERIGNAAHGST